MKKLIQKIDFWTALSWLFGASVLAALSVHTIANPDIFYHLADGARFLKTGALGPPPQVISVTSSFKDIYWLFQLCCIDIMNVAGFAGLTILFGILWFLIFLLWIRTARLNLSRPLGMLLFIAAAVVCQIRFQERPEIFSFLFLTMDIFLFTRDLSHERREGRWRLTLVVVQIFWCNMHGYFFLGPAVAGLWALSQILPPWLGTVAKKPSLRDSAGILAVPVALIFASMISPFGWRTWEIVYDQWKFLGATAVLVNETRATFSYGFLLWNLNVFWCLWIFVAALTSALAYGISNRRKPTAAEIFAFLLSVSGLLLSATVVRNVPLVVLMAAPCLAVYSDALSKVTAKISAPIFTVALPLAFTVWVVNQNFYKSLVHPSRFGVGISAFVFPLEFESFLKTYSIPAGARWFSDGNWGSFLEFYHPALYIYGDSRYAGENVDLFFAAADNSGAFFSLNGREKFDAAVFDVGRSLGMVMTLLKDPRWRLAYRDLSTAFFVNAEKTGEVPPQDLLVGKVIAVKPQGAQAEGNLYEGQDLSERIYGNDAIQWTKAMVATDNLEGLMQVLNQFGQAPVIPSPVLEAGLLYLKLRPDGPLMTKIFALRPKMLTLDDSDGAEVDEKLAQVRAGTYWNSP